MFPTPEIQSKVNRFVRRIVHERSLPDTDVEDIHQEVLIKLLAIPEDRWNAIENVDGYLYKIVKHQVFDYAVGRRNRPEISLEEDIADTTENPKQVVETETGLLLRHIWKSLDPRDRELLELMIIGYTEKEMGFRLGSTHTAVRQRMSRLKARLRQEIRARQKP